MFKKPFVACLAFLAISAQAVPVTFSSWQLGADAVAISDGTPDVQSLTGTSDLITTSAASIGVDVATSGAIAGFGLLSTSADVTGFGGNASSAVASAHFLGAFFGSGDLAIGIDFTSSSFASGSGAGSTTLFVTLISGGTTVYNDYLDGSRLFSFAAAAGSVGSLELTLSSEANAGFLSTTAGGFSTSGLVNVTAVPEPATVLMLAIGLAAIVGMRRAAGRRA